MNKRILHKEVQDFIQQNLKSNITQLVLKGSPFEGISIQELAGQIVSKQKSEKKIPTWFKTDNIYYPPKLNLEQTSSEVTANYKAGLVEGENLLDMTGGFGIDSFAFSKKIKKVLHCEINEELSKIAQHNFKQLDQSNIECVEASAIEYLSKSEKTFDCIYVDPSRRHDKKGKVFLFEDCEPNIPRNIDMLFQVADQVLIKTSPILDISSVINELKFVKDIHIVAVDNEVKELLYFLQKDYTDQIEIKSINIDKKGHKLFSFIYKSKSNSTYSEALKYLYEPNSAILKSGGFHEISNQLKVHKLHLHSHLYTSNELIDFPGRKFEIIDVIPYDKKKVKKAFKEKKANITTRNFPKSVDQIRKDLKLKDGGHYYLFFTKDSNEKFICIICIKR